jgi:hypothetical protein
MRSKRVALCAVVCLVLAGAAAAVFFAHGVGATTSSGVEAASLSALSSDATRLPPDDPTVPAGVDDAHQLGFGFVAWASGQAVCFSTEHTAGCVGALPHPLVVDLDDPDGIHVGEPARVTGLSTDDVASVRVVLRDGRTAQGSPVDNAYRIDLPGDAAIWDVASVVAILRGGETDEQAVNLRALRARANAQGLG